jgi:hypothetical protein
MSITLESVSHNEYLMVRISGEWLLEESDGSINEIHNLYLQHKIPMLLDVREMTSRTTVTDDYYDVKKFSNKGLGTLVRVAILDNLDRKEQNDFFVTTAQNRGLAINIFYSGELEAVDWLLKKY